MITLTSPGALSSQALAAARFCWWYVDVVDEFGNGAVIIVARGMPFLVTAPDKPAVSIALYGGGRQVFYVLQELADDDFAHVVDGDRERVSAGGVSITLRRAADGSLDVDAAFDVVVDGVSDAKGVLALKGVARRAADSDVGEDGVVHAWSVQSGPATAVVDGVFDGKRVRIEGRGYSDRNVGAVDIPALGIGHWWWCRVASDDGKSRVVYALTSSDGAAERVVGLTVDADGHSVVTEGLRLVPRRTTRAFGHQAFVDVDAVDAGGVVFAALRDIVVVERGPFYVRGLLKNGVCEHVWPERFDVGVLAPLVRMRVSPRDARRQSWWLPLFCGLGETRWSRLARAWRARLSPRPSSKPALSPKSERGAPT